MMKRKLGLLALAASIALAVPGSAIAQFSKSYNFLESVEKRDGDEASKLLNEPGGVLINTRDISTGRTALHIVVARRDATWLKFLLGKNANPNVRDKKGITPLMLATQLRFIEGVRILVKQNVKIDESNHQGETALIRAVQLRDAELVRILLGKGANPDLTDTLAGLSARDYATRDRRSQSILAEIEKADANKKDRKSTRLNSSH